MTSKYSNLRTAIKTGLTGLALAATVGCSSMSVVTGPFHVYRGSDQKWFPEWREHPYRTTAVTAGYIALGIGAYELLKKDDDDGHRNSDLGNHNGNGNNGGNDDDGDNPTPAPITGGNGSEGPSGQ